MKIKTIILTALLVISFSLLTAQGTWTHKADYGGNAFAMGCAFVINEKAYVADHEVAMWEYDPSINQWSQKAALPAFSRNSHAFVIGDYGYVVAYCYTETKVWQYSPATDQWIQKNNFPGEPRDDGVAFSIGDKGYYGLGEYVSYFSDLWEYDPSTDQWTQITNMPVARCAAAVFTLNGKAYIGLGSLNGTNVKDFWEYNPASNTWNQLADFAGTARRFPCSFVIGEKAYVGTGNDGSYKRDFWEYNALNDTWQQVNSLPSYKRAAAVAFTINNKGYVTTGYDGSYFVIYYKDLWEYTPDYTISEITDPIAQVSVFPNPSTNKIEIQMPDMIQSVNIFNTAGVEVMSFSDVNENSLSIDVSVLTKGMYLIEINDNNAIFTCKIVIN